MRRLFTTEQFLANGGTNDQLTAMAKFGLCVRVRRGVYAEGGDQPDVFATSLAQMLAHKTAVWGLVAAHMHGFDGVELVEEFRRRNQTIATDKSLVEVGGHLCTGPLQTLIDIAAFVDDCRWEQALEFTLRTKLVSIDELIALLPSLSQARTHGIGRMRRVIELRPLGAPPTESLLETLFVQLARLVPGLPPPVRQFRVINRHGTFVARVDLCWPELGVFIELDGQQHIDQPVYDAARQTAVGAATGWLCGRFTWRQVRHNPRATARQLAELVEQARLRPVVGL